MKMYKSKQTPYSWKHFKYSATERQAIKKDLEENTPPLTSKHYNSHDVYSDPEFSSRYDRHDWLSYSHTCGTIGGRFLSVLEKLTIVDVKNDIWMTTGIYNLFNKIGVAPSGLIYSDPHNNKKLKDIFNKNTKTDSIDI